MLLSLCLYAVSFVDNIVPFDKRKRRVVQLSLLASAKTYNDYAEFDTEESANDWRRELSGWFLFRDAIYYSQNLIKALCSIIGISRKITTPLLCMIMVESDSIFLLQ